MSQKDISAGVRVISILYFIGALLSFLAGVLLILVLSLFEEGLPNFFDFEMGIVIVVLFVLAIFEFVVGLGLWRGRFWAILVAMIFAVLGIMFATYLIIVGEDVLVNIFHLLLHIFILSFFLYDFYKNN